MSTLDIFGNPIGLNAFVRVFAAKPETIGQIITIDKHKNEVKIICLDGNTKAYNTSSLVRIYTSYPRNTSIEIKPKDYVKHVQLGPLAIVDKIIDRYRTLIICENNTVAAFTDLLVKVEIEDLI